MQKSFVEIDQENQGDYLRFLTIFSNLSKLFSDNTTPLIDYRAVENIFCRSFKAENLSRSDTAFDAKYNNIGIGLKTFICKSKNSVEKVAEFNSLSDNLKELKGKKLAEKLAEYRNARIQLANRLFNIQSSIYHIVARREKKLLLFETDYSEIDINSICNIKENRASLQFEDNKHFYSFNYSKSALSRKFIIPSNAFELPVEIMEDPYDWLLEVLQDNKKLITEDKLVKGINYVILPLYSTRTKEKEVPQKSGLNQWNAGGRERDINEVYIPIPINIHKYYPDFFPPRDKKFSLKVPTGEILSAKVCQDNSKALMTDPNKALSDWLLRKVLNLKEGELATIEKLNKLGFDSVMITKEDETNYKISIASTNSYEKFIL
ncbi:MAG: NgoFVII family restriction endonuclease [Raineya sp.]|nr:NgoFVII family restriction endonuclease [Raineya sp.]